jgi:type IV pilus assembly protein PilQ
MDRQILSLQLSALEQEGKGAIIARPHLLIEDNKEAVIEAGTEIPYAEKTKSGATSTIFKKAVLRLKVRPRCLPDQRLLLVLEVNHDKVSSLTVLGTPAIETQGLMTEVAVSSGQTIVLGGLFTVTQSQQTEQLPWLGKIPGIGVLFRWQTQQVSRKELTIFISPRIV